MRCEMYLYEAFFLIYFAEIIIKFFIFAGIIIGLTALMWIIRLSRIPMNMPELQEDITIMDFIYGVISKLDNNIKKYI